MRNSPSNKRGRSKSKDVPIQAQQVKYIEIRQPLNVPRQHDNRKFSVSDSNDSTINSPSSSSDGFMGYSEIEEMSMMDLAMELNSEVHLNSSNNPLITRAIPIDYKLTAHSLPKTSYIKPPTRANRSATYSTSLQNSFLSTGLESSPPIPYRGGRRKEPPPPSMTDEQKRQWQKERAKKDSHNKVEKKRRLKINECITEIGYLLPRREAECNSSDEKRKGKILQMAIEYIRDLQDDCNKHMQLQSKYESLENNNKQLKEALRLLKSTEIDGNSLNFLQNLSQSFQDAPTEQMIKREQPIQKDVSYSFPLEGIKEPIDFNGNIAFQSDYITDDFLLKNEQDLDALLSRRLDLPGSMEDPYNSMPSIELDHQLASVLSFPGYENLVNTGYVGSFDGNNFMYLEQFDPVFPDIQTEVSTSLDYPMNHNFHIS